MERWRQTGYVPDSEDEEEDLLEWHRAEKDALQHGKRTNDGSKTTEEHEGIIVRETLWSSASQGSLVDPTRSANTLKHIDSSLPLPTIVPVSTLINTQSSSQSPSDSQLANDLALQPSPELLPTRTFRARNAVQLNPFSIEALKYKTSLAGTGVKPTYVRVTSPPRHARKDEESQDSEFLQSSQAQDSLEPDSFPVLDANNVMDGYESNLDSNQVGGDLGDDGLIQDVLPDIGDILTRDLPPLASAKQRGRRVESVSLVSPDHFQAYDMLSSDGEGLTTLLPSKRVSRPQDSFPSPTRSGSLDSLSQIDTNQTVLPNVDHSHLPTPVLSSAVNSLKRARPVDGPSDVQSLSSDDSVELSENEESIDDEEFQGAQGLVRRIRGVLPASWLKLDEAQQNADKRKRLDLQVNRLERQEIGVAQKKVGSAEKTKSFDLEDLLSSESEDDRPAQVARMPSAQVQSRLQDYMRREQRHITAKQAVVIDDQDEIDAMLPTPTRHREVDKKYQQRLPQYSSSGPLKARPSWKTGHGVVQSIRKDISAESHRKKQRFSDLKIYPSQAPDTVPQISQRDMPVFLKAVARTLKRRHASGVSPSSKIFSLADDADTTDVLASMGSRQNNANRVCTTGIAKPHAGVALRQTNKVSRRYSHSSSVDAEHVNSKATRVASSMEAVTVNRVTRLKSMLAHGNRSGKGHLASLQPQLRATQWEAPILSASVALSSTTHSAHRKEQPQETGDHGDLNTDHHPCHLFKRAEPPQGQKRLVRKIVPTQLDREKQTEISSFITCKPRLAIDPRCTTAQIQLMLEAEYQEYHLAWFQGTSREQNPANVAIQERFHQFLYALEQHLPRILDEMNDSGQERRIRSFLHRFVPNRGQIGGQGQIGNKIQSVQASDILVAENLFGIHSCLLAIAPLSAPRPRVMEMKVDFSQAHHSICMVALSSWKQVCLRKDRDPYLAIELSTWMYSMLFQLLDRWKAAETDAKAEAAISARKIDDEVLQTVIEHNRAQTCQLTHIVLCSFREAVVDCMDTSEAFKLLNVAKYSEYVALTSCKPELQEMVLWDVVALTEIGLQPDMLKQENGKHISSLFDSLRQLITAVTNTRTNIGDDFLSKTTQKYYKFARKCVQIGQHSWEQLINVHSPYALDTVVANLYRQTFKTGFYLQLIEHTTDVYRTEFRAPVLAHWLGLLLSEPDRIDTWSTLTEIVLQHEKESLQLTVLAEKLQFTDRRHVMQPISTVRSSVVNHIIEQIHLQVEDPEDEWLLGGLEALDLLQLLRVIFGTMKEQWLLLVNDPSEQIAYMTFIHSTLDQYEKYSRPEFKVDPWFYDAAAFPQRRKNTLLKLFRHECDVKTVLTPLTKQTFHEEVLEVKRYGQFGDLRAELLAIFLPLTTNTTSLDLSYVDYHAGHAGLLQQMAIVCEKVNEEWLNVQGNMLELLTEILGRVHYQVDVENGGALTPILPALPEVIAVLVIMLRRRPDHRLDLVFRLTRLTWLLVLSTGYDLAPQSIEDINTICDQAAARSDCANDVIREEAAMLLQVVMDSLL